MSKQVKVLFVCLGNICRSPVAEGVFRQKVQDVNLQSMIEIDSAGTGAWHVGNPPDHRMSATAKRHGVDLTGQRARQFVRTDLSDYDYVLAMDASNRRDILRQDDGQGLEARVSLFREWDPDPGDYDVPDPYYGGTDGFEDVYAIVCRTTDALLRDLIARHGLS